jgi:hypothetical protein
MFVPQIINVAAISALVFIAGAAHNLQQIVAPAGDQM